MDDIRAETRQAMWSISAEVELGSAHAREEGVPFGSGVDDHRAVGVTAVADGDAAAAVEEGTRLNATGKGGTVGVDGVKRRPCHVCYRMWIDSSR